MKTLYLSFVMLLCTLGMFAQVPQKMSYQAIVRNSGDMIMANQNVGMQISILQGSASGPAVYVETQTPTTNANGLASIEIGTGNTISGDFTTIDWANNTYFIRTEIDPFGGTSYTITGTSQLASVPYALYAANSGSSIPGPEGPQGPQGPQGIQGIAGSDGADGDSAYQIWLAAGNTGTEADFLNSLVGPQGTQGIQGIAGTDGADGANGSDGADGDSAYQIWIAAGNTGTEADFLNSLVGPQGVQGIQGIAGTDGANGSDGSDGDSAYQIWIAAGNTGTEADFLNSLVGPQGPQGPQGTQGIQGIAGTDGANGANGSDGADGDSAYQIWIAAGNTGTEADFLNSLVGPQGLQGTQGIQGIAGTDGADGANGSDGDSAYQIWLAAGNTGTEADFLNSLVGPQGTQGIQGIAGTDGADGANGSDGADGDSAYQIWIAAGNTGTEADFLNSLVGPQGPQGTQGIQGIAGTDGADGANGSDGADGDSAYQIWLAAGNTGTEADFLNSLVGPQGPQGTQGIQGIAGTDGADGANGSDGSDGDSAYQIWIAAGNTGTEADFLNSLVGPQGVQGIQGIAGTDGADGANGSDGADGDSAYRIWLNAGNTGTEADFLNSLVGSQGPQGTQGPQGIQGIAGTDGADGANGSDGTDGDSAYQVWIAAGNTGTEADFLNSLVGPQGAQAPVINDLTTGGITDALSAEQGKTLQDTKLTSTLADANVFIGNATNVAVATVLSGDATLANNGALTISDNAVDGTDISLAGEAAGDVMYYDGADWISLPKGTAGQVLAINDAGTAPEWKTIATSGSNGKRIGEFVYAKSGKTEADGYLAVTPGTVTNGAINYPLWAAQYPEFVSGNDIVFPADVAGMFLRNSGGNAASEGAYQNYRTARPTSTNFVTNNAGAHSHTIPLYNNDGAGGRVPDGRAGSFTGNASTSTSGNHSHTITGGGDVETNPVNRAYQLYTIVDTY